MINLFTSLLYVVSYINGTHHISTDKYDPCDKITSVELAFGCSTVDGKRVYSYNKLVALAKLTEGELQRFYN